MPLFVRYRLKAFLILPSQLWEPKLQPRVSDFLKRQLLNPPQQIFLVSNLPRGSVQHLFLRSEQLPLKQALRPLLVSVIEQSALID